MKNKTFFFLGVILITMGGQLVSCATQPSVIAPPITPVQDATQEATKTRSAHTQTIAPTRDYCDEKEIIGLLKGKILLSLKKESAYPHIYTLDLSDAKIRQITQSDFGEGDAELSHDRTKMVFVSDRDRRGHPSIYIMDMKDNQGDIILENTDPALMVADAGLEYFENPTWSYSDRYIAFANEYGSNFSKIRVLDITSQSEHIINNNRAENLLPVWLADQEALVLLNKSEDASFYEGFEFITVLDLWKNEKPKYLFQETEIYKSTRFQINGINELIYISQTEGISRVMILDIDGESEPLEFLRSETFISNPQWSPDGNRVSIISRDTDGTNEILIFDKKSKQNMQKIKDKGIINYLWSPDSNFISYERKEGPGKDSEYFVVFSPVNDELRNCNYVKQVLGPERGADLFQWYY